MNKRLVRRCLYSGIASCFAVVLAGTDCNGGTTSPGGGGGGGGGTPGGGNSGCTTVTDRTTEQRSDAIFPEAMLVPDPSCTAMGRMYVTGQEAEAEITYDNPVSCGNVNGQQMTVRNLRVAGEYRFGFRYTPSPVPVLAHCAPSIAAIASLHPVVTFEVTGDVELQRARDWTTTGGVSVPHYEISNSRLSFTRLDVAHADPFADLVRTMVRRELLDAIDEAVSDGTDGFNCLCDEVAPDSADYPTYQQGYDPR